MRHLSHTKDIDVGSDALLFLHLFFHVVDIVFDVLHEFVDELVLPHADTLGLRTFLNHRGGRHVEAKDDGACLVGIIEVTLSDGSHAVVNDINAKEPFNVLVRFL